jgi:hypothetical protein
MRWTNLLLLLPTLALAADATRPSYAPAATKPALIIDEQAIPREADESQLGLHVPRTMALLKASEQGETRPLRVLFYGQSIVAQARLQSTFVNDLRRHYPKATIIPTNNAIGGYEAPKLLRTMVHDVVSFRPDLIVFDDYGGEEDSTYEQIIQYLRSQTTAEVTLWSPHVDNFGAGIDKAREVTAAFRRKMADKYRCEFADVRAVWKRFLEEQKLPRTALLNDQIHNNNPGCELMAHILSRHFVANPAARDAGTAVQSIAFTDPAQLPRLGVTIIGPSRLAADGKSIELPDTSSRIELTFTGNRVDLLADAEASTGGGRILLDGDAPSKLIECWTCSRATLRPAAGSRRSTASPSAAPPTAKTGHSISSTSRPTERASSFACAAASPAPMAKAPPTRILSPTPNASVSSHPTSPAPPPPAS